MGAFRPRLRSLLAMCFLAGSAGLVVAQTPYEDVLKSMLEVLDRTTMSLAKIQDADSAKETVPELKKATADFLEVRTKASKFEPPSREEKDRLAKEYKPKFDDAKKKLVGEIERVKRTPGGKEVLAEIRGILDPEKK